MIDVSRPRRTRSRVAARCSAPRRAVLVGAVGPQRWPRRPRRPRRRPWWPRPSIRTRPPDRAIASTPHATPDASRSSRAFTRCWGPPSATSARRSSPTSRPLRRRGPRPPACPRPRTFWTRPRPSFPSRTPTWTSTSPAARHGPSAHHHRGAVDGGLAVAHAAPLRLLGAVLLGGAPQMKLYVLLGPREAIALCLGRYGGRWFAAPLDHVGRVEGHHAKSRTTSHTSSHDCAIRSSQIGVVSGARSLLETPEATHPFTQNNLYGCRERRRFVPRCRMP